MKKGIDISYCQKGLDLAAAKAAGAEFAIIRAGISTRTDTEFAIHTQNAVKNGLPYGFYWYSRAFSVKEAIAEADACITAIAPYAPTYPVFYDMEEQDQIDRLDSETRTAIIAAFCDRISRAGYIAGVYINPSWMENYVDKTQLIGKYDIWLAHWTGSPDAPTKYDYGQAIWQWGTDKICGLDVDCNICYVEYYAQVEQPVLSDATAKMIPLGTVVTFAGGLQYPASESSVGSKANAGTVRISNRAPGTAHPYHVISTDDSGVYGWVDADKLSVQSIAQDEAVVYKAGQPIELTNAGLYAAVTAVTPVKNVSGTYYLYDGKEIEGFLRICPSIGNVGKTPIAANVTGWVKSAEIK